MTACIAYGYVRISTTEQAQGFGLDVQEERIRDYAQRKGLPALQIFSESKSGESITQRHEFNTMMAQAEAKGEEGFQVHIVFASLDRLSRKLFDQETIVLRCFAKRVRLHSAQEAENDTLDPAHSDDPMRTVIRQFFGVFHQFDKAIIQRRMDGGLRAKGIRGGFTGGRPPFGYKSINQELVVDEEKAAAVRTAFALRKGIAPLTVIAAILKQRYPTVCRSFAVQHVSRLLAREDLYRHGKYSPRFVDGKVTVRPELIILRDEDDEALTVGAHVGPFASAVSMDWEECPARMHLDIAAYVLGVPASRIREAVAAHHIPVHHQGDSLHIPKESLIRLHKHFGETDVAA